MPVFDDVQQQGPRRQLLDRAGGFLFRFEALEEADVGADVAGRCEPGDAVIVAVRLICVRAGDEEDVSVGSVDGSAGGADA